MHLKLEDTVPIEDSYSCTCKRMMRNGILHIESSGARQVASRRLTNGLYLPAPARSECFSHADAHLFESQTKWLIA